MKKYILAFLFLCSSAYAGPIVNPYVFAAPVVTTLLTATVPNTGDSMVFVFNIPVWGQSGGEVLGSSGITANATDTGADLTDPCTGEGTNTITCAVSHGPFTAADTITLDAITWFVHSDESNGNQIADFTNFAVTNNSTQ